MYDDDGTKTFAGLIPLLRSDFAQIGKGGSKAASLLDSAWVGF
jgi:hypothetical protein